MDCRMLRNLYAKADGGLPCGDDLGESVVLGKVSLSPGWSIDAHLNSDYLVRILVSESAVWSAVP